MPRKRKKKPHGQGDPKLLALISDLEARAKLLSIEEQTARVARERHAILVDFVLHQELVLHLLQHGVPLPPGPARESVPPVASYVAAQLLAVTPAQLAEVQAWSSEADIKRLTQDLFQRLVVLLELLQRPASEEEEQEEQGHQERPASDDDAAGDDVGGGGSGLRGEYAKELDARIDRAVTLACLGLLVNCTPIVDCAANHQAVPEANEAVAAPDHWAKVVRRLGLTQQQLLHLRIAFDEYRRLSAGAAEAGKELLRKAAATRAVEAAAEANQLAAAAAAAAAASAGGSASGSGSIASRAPSSSQPSSSSSQGAGMPSSSSGSFGAAAAAATAVTPPDTSLQHPEAAALPPGGPEELAGEFQKHLDYRLLHMTVVSMFLLNTLSRAQIAQMIVASFPFQCVTAAIVEAAAHLQEEQEQQVGAAASAAAVVPDAEAHFARRRAAMQQQLQRWWQDMGALPI